MKSKSHLSEFVEDPKALKLFEQERLLVDAASLIYRAMRRKKINRKKLADMLGVSKGRITQCLCGEKNLTLRTLADIFTAMGSRIRLREEDISIDAEEWQDLDLPTPAILKDRKWAFIDDSVNASPDEISLAG
jgi:transcriptional regulator with XRE-family HTH domain